MYRFNIFILCLSEPSKKFVYPLPMQLINNYVMGSCHVNYYEKESMDYRQSRRVFSRSLNASSEHLQRPLHNTVLQWVEMNWIKTP